MKNHEKLLSLYNELDDLLRQRYGQTDRSRSVIVTLVKELERTGVSKYIQAAKKLDSIRVLRNNLIHEFDMNCNDLFQVSDEAVKFLEDIVTQVRNPKRALNIATPLSKMVYFVEGQEFHIEEIIKKMVDNGYSQIPVLNKNGTLYGVFSPNALFDYLASNVDAKVIDIKQEELSTHLIVKNHKFESYLFVARDALIEKVSDAFVTGYQTNKKPVLAFVTEHGLESEKIMGVIALSDLLK